MEQSAAWRAAAAARRGGGSRCRQLLPAPTWAIATIDGTAAQPWAFFSTRGAPPSSVATAELVVPRSMPTTAARGATDTRRLHRTRAAGPRRAPLPCTHVAPPPLSLAWQAIQ